VIKLFKRMFCASLKRSFADMRASSQDDADDAKNKEQEEERESVQKATKQESAAESRAGRRHVSKRMKTKAKGEKTQKKNKKKKENEKEKDEDTKKEEEEAERQDRENGEEEDEEDEDDEEEEEKEAEKEAERQESEDEKEKGESHGCDNATLTLEDLPKEVICLIIDYVPDRDIQRCLLSGRVFADSYVGTPMDARRWLHGNLYDAVAKASLPVLRAMWRRAGGGDLQFTVMHMTAAIRNGRIDVARWVIRKVRKQRHRSRAADRVGVVRQGSREQPFAAAGKLLDGTVGGGEGHVPDATRLMTIALSDESCRSDCCHGIVSTSDLSDDMDVVDKCLGHETYCATTAAVAYYRCLLRRTDRGQAHDPIDALRMLGEEGVLCVCTESIVAAACAPGAFAPQLLRFLMGKVMQRPTHALLNVIDLRNACSSALIAAVKSANVSMGAVRACLAFADDDAVRQAIDFAAGLTRPAFLRLLIHSGIGVRCAFEGALLRPDAGNGPSYSLCCGGGSAERYEDLPSCLSELILSPVHRSHALRRAMDNAMMQGAATNVAFLHEACGVQLGSLHMVGSADVLDFVIPRMDRNQLVRNALFIITSVGRASKSLEAVNVGLVRALPEISNTPHRMFYALRLAVSYGCNALAREILSTPAKDRFRQEEWCDCLVEAVVAFDRIDRDVYDAIACRCCPHGLERAADAAFWLGRHALRCDLLRHARPTHRIVDSLDPRPSLSSTAVRVRDKAPVCFSLWWDANKYSALRNVVANGDEDRLSALLDRIGPMLHDIIEPALSLETTAQPSRFLGGGGGGSDPAAAAGGGGGGGRVPQCSPIDLSMISIFKTAIANKHTRILRVLMIHFGAMSAVPYANDSRENIMVDSMIPSEARGLIAYAIRNMSYSCMRLLFAALDDRHVASVFIEMGATLGRFASLSVVRYLNAHNAIEVSSSGERRGGRSPVVSTTIATTTVANPHEWNGGGDESNPRRLALSDTVADDTPAGVSVALSPSLPRLPPPSSTVSFVQLAIEGALSEGDLSMLRFLHLHINRDRTLQIQIDDAVSNGHFAIVRYAWLRYACGLTSWAFDKAASRGHARMVRFLHAHDTVRGTTRALDKSASHGQLNIVAFLVGHAPRYRCTDAAVYRSAINGHARVLQLLVSQRNHSHERLLCFCRTLQDAVARNVWPCVAILMDRVAPEFTSRRSLTHALARSSTGGCTAVIAIRSRLFSMICAAGAAPKTADDAI